MKPTMRSKTLFACMGPTLALASCGPLVSLVLVVALIIGGYWAVRSVANSPTVQAIGKQISTTRKEVLDYSHEQTEPHSPPLSAEEILRQRYARGEIDRRQYLEMMEDLRKKQFGGH